MRRWILLVLLTCGNCSADLASPATDSGPADAAEQLDHGEVDRDSVRPGADAIDDTPGPLLDTLAVPDTTAGPPDGGCAGAVNFSAHGAKGDGVTDDTAALQKALAAESALCADPGAIFKISSTLEITGASAQTIEWNGATLSTSAALIPMIRIDKRAQNGGLTIMRSLIVDGQRKAVRGVEVNSRVELVDVDVRGFRQPTSSSPAGFYINLHDAPAAHGIWTFDGCDVRDVIGASNGSTTDSLGAANGYLIYWRAVPKTPITLEVKNATVRDCWGEDAQNVAIFSPGIDIGTTTSGTRWINMTFLDWERRAIKGFAANNTFITCSFTDPNPADPDLYSSNKSGMVVVGTGSGAKGGDNQLFDGCSFNRAGYDGRVIVVDAKNVVFRNSTFAGGADLRFTSFGSGGIGKVEVCASTFGPGSVISDYGAITYQGGDVISLDTDNTYVESAYIKVDAAFYELIDLSCPL